MLAGLLDPLLSTCTFFLPQLAEDGSAEPSPLSLRLMGSSRLPWRAWTVMWPIPIEALLVQWIEGGQFAEVVRLLWPRMMMEQIVV